MAQHVVAVAGRQMFPQNQLIYSSLPQIRANNHFWSYHEACWAHGMLHKTLEKSCARASGHLRGNAEQCAVPGWLTPPQFEPRSGPARVTETSMLGSSGIET